MKFLVCYDEAGRSTAVLKEALAHARIWGATLEIVKTVTRELPLKHSKILEMEEEFEAAVRKHLQGDTPPCSVQLLVTSLEPGEKMVNYSEEENIDLVFVGIEKKSKVGKLFFGSTAQYMILHAACPVVAVKV